MSKTKKAAKAFFSLLGDIAEAVEKSNEAAQKLKEQETVAHIRGERHNEKMCQICVAETEEYETPDCTKHEFGECKANCRYRTGVVEDCTFHELVDCDADCEWRK